MTASANSAWTSAQWNTHVRDNLLMTMPGKATSGNNWFVSDGVNSIIQRSITSASVATGETTTSTTYTGLTTPGPEVTVTTGTTALVLFGCRMSNSLADVMNRASVAVSGATTIAASDTWALRDSGRSATKVARSCMAHLFTTLNAGSNTFTMQYDVASASTGTFQSRHLIVMAF